MSAAGGFFDLGDFIEDVGVVAGQEMASGDNHVNFVGAFGDGESCVFEFSAQGILAGGEAGGLRRGELQRGRSGSDQGMPLGGDHADSGLSPRRRSDSPQQRGHALDSG